MKAILGCSHVDQGLTGDDFTSGPGIGAHTEAGDGKIAQITKKRSFYVSAAIARIIKMYDLRKSYVFMIRVIAAET